jgi:hypothetical protein
MQRPKRPNTRQRAKTSNLDLDDQEFGNVKVAIEDRMKAAGLLGGRLNNGNALGKLRKLLDELKLDGTIPEKATLSADSNNILRATAHRINHNFIRRHKLRSAQGPPSETSPTPDAETLLRHGRVIRSASPLKRDGVNCTNSSERGLRAFVVKRFEEQSKGQGRILFRAAEIMKSSQAAVAGTIDDLEYELFRERLCSKAILNTNEDTILGDLGEGDGLFPIRDESEWKAALDIMERSGADRYSFVVANLKHEQPALG